MIAALLLLPLLAQSGTADIDLSAFRPPTLEEDRLTVCLGQANSDPSTAMLHASTWAAEAYGAERSFPLQCLGIAYTRLLRWKAAEDAFMAGRDAALESNPLQRAKLAAMAGNSAIADMRFEDALRDLAIASSDAVLANDTTLGGEIEIDRARALVALGRTGEAGAALEIARSDAPQNSDSWLLSATLARRAGDLPTAQSHILTAAGLNRTSPAIGLEAGVIAALSGNDEAARKSWQSVLQTAPDAPEAATAKDYLAQISAPAAPPGEPAE